jgi:hypothetical protein
LPISQICESKKRKSDVQLMIDCIYIYFELGTEAEEGQTNTPLNFDDTCHEEGALVLTQAMAF